MATEKTSLLPKNYGTYDDTKSKCYVDIPKQLLGDENNNYIALTHEELLKYVDDPWWQLLRRIIMILFWATMIVMLVSACIISVLETQQTCPAARRNFTPSQHIDLLPAMTLFNTTDSVAPLQID